MKAGEVIKARAKSLKITSVESRENGAYKGEKVTEGLSV